MPGNPRLIILASGAGLLLAVMLILPDLTHHVGNVVALLLATSILYILSAFLILKDSQPRPVLVRLILFAAIVFRLTVFPLWPSFSDDLYRYRWEGKLQSAGGNPYVSAPADPEWAHLKDPTYPNVDGKTIRAVYGPLTELLQHAAYRVISAFTSDPARQVFWFKLPAALADLGAIAALLALLRARGLPPQRILIYAWCPVPIFEFWATGHNDAWIVCLLALALAAAAREQHKTAYLWLSLAAAAKIWPLILFPAFTGWRPRRAALAGLILAGVAAIAIAPFGAAVFSNRDFASGFLGGWRNNDSLFGFVLSFSRDARQAKHITFGLVAIAAIAISLTKCSLERKVLATVAGMLLFSSNVHPWYSTWLLPAMVVEPVPALLLFVSAVPVFYESVIGWTLLRQWQGLSWLRWVVYAGTGLVALIPLMPRRSPQSPR